MLTNISSGCGTYSNSDEYDFNTMMCCGVSLVAGIRIISYWIIIYIVLITFQKLTVSFCPVPPGSPCMYDEGSPFVQEFVDPANSSLVIPTAVGIFSKTPSCALSSRSVYTQFSRITFTKLSPGLSVEGWRFILKIWAYFVSERVSNN